MQVIMFCSPHVASSASSSRCVSVMPMCYGVEAGSVDKDSKCQRTVKETQNDLKKNPYFIKKQSKSNRHLAKHGCRTIAQLLSYVAVTTAVLAITSQIIN